MTSFMLVEIRRVSPTTWAPTCSRLTVRSSDAREHDAPKFSGVINLGVTGTDRDASP